MMSRLTSKVSSRAQTVIPREVRERLGLEPGDLLAYRYTESGVVIEKCAPVRNDPFAAFTEWASPEDDEAYGGL
jgi:antitoxin PrlF